MVLGVGVCTMGLAALFGSGVSIQQDEVQRFKKLTKMRKSGPITPNLQQLTFPFHH